MYRRIVHLNPSGACSIERSSQGELTFKIAGKKDQGLVAVASVPVHNPISTQERTLRRTMTRAHKNWFSSEDFAQGYVQRAKRGEIFPYDTWQRIKMHNNIKETCYDCAHQENEEIQNVPQQELLL